MPHTHAPTKAAACHEALDHFVEEHHHAPNAHEKARVISDAIKEWEHETVEAMHAADVVAQPTAVAAKSGVDEATSGRQEFTAPYTPACASA
jgi:hypothetical protein